mmetsp:Transcript_7772/g.22777  ORF Transcript_7772/g.22777 Transcript_7772/m.22777 type:complete len:258 (+) Transcript_7772:244-1017(+)
MYAPVASSRTTTSFSKPPAPSWPLADGSTSPPKINETPAPGKDPPTHTLRGRMSLSSSPRHVSAQLPEATSKTCPSLDSSPINPATTPSELLEFRGTKVAPPLPLRCWDFPRLCQVWLVMSNRCMSLSRPLEQPQPPKTYRLSPMQSILWKDRASGTPSPPSLLGSTSDHFSLPASPEQSNFQRSFMAFSCIVIPARPPKMYTVDDFSWRACAWATRNGGGSQVMERHAPSVSSVPKSQAQVASCASRGVRAMCSPP